MLINAPTIRSCARRAKKLADLVDGEGLRSSAFAVLFAMLLGDAKMPTSNEDGEQKPKQTRIGRATKGGPMGRLRELSQDGFFTEGRTLKATLVELTDRGHGYSRAIVGKTLQRLVRDRILRRSKRNEGGHDVYIYTEW